MVFTVLRWSALCFVCSMMFWPFGCDRKSDRYVHLKKTSDSYEVIARCDNCHRVNWLALTRGVRMDEQTVTQPCERCGCPVTHPSDSSRSPFRKVE